MREDFNKLMVERERFGHTWKFGDVRNSKANRAFTEDTLGGKESMHKQRRGAKGVANSRKRFNENLNPLKNFLRVNVGKPWDNVYSEITATFDKRKVINNHILEHLFEYVELKVYIVDGKPHTLNISRYGSEREYDPIEWSPRYPTYYVDPRDGLLKTPKQTKTKRQEEAEGLAKATERLNKLYHKIDADNHLFFKDGIWWVYTAKAKPPQIEETYYAPGPYIPWHKRAAAALVRETPEELEARKRTRLVDAPTRDKLDIPSVPGFNPWGRGPHIIPTTKYFYKRQTASHKLLKQAGVAGTAEANDEICLSHREANRHRSLSR